MNEKLSRRDVFRARLMGCDWDNLPVDELADEFEAAVVQARSEALEEAARIAEEHDCRGPGSECSDECDICLVARQIADCCRLIASEPRSYP